jgi:hypothetical protein
METNLTAIIRSAICEEQLAFYLALTQQLAGQRQEQQQEQALLVADQLSEHRLTWMRAWTTWRRQCLRWWRRGLLTLRSSPTILRVRYLHTPAALMKLTLEVQTKLTMEVQQTPVQVQHLPGQAQVDVQSRGNAIRPSP